MQASVAMAACLQNRMAVFTLLVPIFFFLFLLKAYSDMEVKRMKMECPKCSKKITSLKYEVIDCKTLEYGTFSLKRGYPVYVKEEIVDSDFSQYLYSCPRCGQMLFDVPEEAYQFLSKRR